MTVHVTVPLDEASKAELDRLAGLENVSVETLLMRLVERELEDVRQLREDVARGIESAENEPLLDHADVMAAAQRRLSQDRG